MYKKILIVILALTTLAGGVYWITNKNNKINIANQSLKTENTQKEITSAQNKEITSVVENGEPKIETPSAEEIEAKRQAEEWKKIWTDTYQIGASHPNNYDPVTFEAVDEFYAKDKNNVYFVQEESKGTAVTFKTVYTIGVIKGADSKSFVSAKYPYSKDAKNVYYYGKNLSGMDAETFQTLGMNYTKDKNYAYFQNIKISSADLVTFVYLNGYYAKDSKNVYYNGKKISKADPASFVTINAREAYDNNYNYYDGKIKNKRQ